MTILYVTYSDLSSVCVTFCDIFFFFYEFKNRLKQLRTEHNKTQKNIADALDLTRTAIVNYESGTREPSIAIILRLCNYFEVSADYLLGRSDY